MDNDNMPNILKARDVAEFMGVSLTKAYELMRQTDFPVLDGMGGCKRVRRDSFLNWVDSKERRVAK